jgi:hypothetical protein
MWHVVGIRRYLIPELLMVDGARRVAAPEDERIAARYGLNDENMLENETLKESSSLNLEEDNQQDRQQHQLSKKQIQKCRSMSKLVVFTQLTFFFKCIRFGPSLSPMGLAPLRSKLVFLQCTNT